MRWSWTSFAAGMLATALLALLAFVASDDPAPPEARSVPDDWLAPDSAAAVPDRGPEPASPAPRHERPRVAPPATPPSEPGPPPVGDAEGRATFASGDIVTVDDLGGRFRGNLSVSFSSSNGLIRIYATGPTDSSPALLAWAKERAAEVVPLSDPVARPDAAARLHADTCAERAIGIGLALRTTPPALDLLVAASRDTTYPDLRATALRAAAEAAPHDERVQDAILDALRAGDTGLRRTASEFVRMTGDEGARRAAAILIAGDYTDAVLGNLAQAVAASHDVAAFLGSSPPPDAALAVVQALGKRIADPKTDDERTLAALLPELVRPLLDAPQADQHAARILPQLAALGHGSFLRGIAGTSLYRPAVRSAAVAAALGNDDTRPDGIAAAAAVLSDPGATVSLVTSVLGAVKDEWFDDATLRSALSAAARTHPSAWVRDAATERLARVDPTSVGTLVIHEAVYGAAGGYVDVTDALRTAVAEGHLRVQAGNDLAGDPRPGAHKTLRVEYSVGGVRHLRTVGEGAWLALP